jgi:hypothetical protein
MACTECNTLKNITDLSRPYVLRICRKCSRKIELRTPVADGMGFNVEEGDQLIIPAGFLTMSANPLKGSGPFRLALAMRFGRAQAHT